MGRTARFTYSHGSWRRRWRRREPYLDVQIHDSDIAAVRYAPAGAANGLFWLGFQPRDYFDDPDAGPWVERRAEAFGFAEWVRVAEGRDIDPLAVEALLPLAGQAEPLDDFVEETLLRLLDLAGIPPPPSLAGEPPA